MRATLGKSESNKELVSQKKIDIQCQMSDTISSSVDYNQRMEDSQREVAILDKEIETLNKHLHKV
jgi:hypothetical protein